MTDSDQTRKVSVRQRSNNYCAHRISSGIAALIVFTTLSACTSSAPTATTTPTTEPTPEPSPTPLPPQPDTALEAALAKFDTYQSYRVSYKQVHESGVYETIDTVYNTQYVDTVNSTSFIDSSSETLQKSTFKKLCTEEQCYKSDATGFYKPTSGEYFPPKPAFSFLDMDSDHVLDNGYTYIGEELKDERNTLKYQVQASEAQMADPELSLLQPAPEIYFYVDAQTGDLLAYDTNYHITYLSAQDNYQVSYSYSGWNDTQVPIPDVVELTNTELQMYDGILNSLLTFEFPIVDYLDESYNLPNLTAPSGSRMDIRIYATIATLTMIDEAQDINKSRMCEMVYREFMLAYDKTGATLEQAEWVEGTNLPFCKGIINTANGQQARYLFNEPNEVTQRNGRLLPLTFIIMVTPVEGEDIDAAFWDVIDSIQFNQM